MKTSPKMSFMWKLVFSTGKTYNLIACENFFNALVKTLDVCNTYQNKIWQLFCFPQVLVIYFFKESFFLSLLVMTHRIVVKII